jgi:DNA-binding response OmpR family regulator
MLNGHSQSLRRLLEAYERVSAGHLRLNPDLQLLSCEGRGVELTATETAMMHALLRSAGSTVPQRELIASLWPQHDPKTCKNRLYAHVFTLRRKLAQACTGASIQRSLHGYRLTL